MEIKTEIQKIPLRKEKSKLQNFLFSNSEIQMLDDLKAKTNFPKTQLVKYGVLLLNDYFVKNGGLYSKLKLK